MTTSLILKCPQCNTSFECGVNTEACWCRDLSPKVVTEAAGDRCLCYECLSEKASEV